MAARPIPFDALHVEPVAPPDEDAADAELPEAPVEVVGHLVPPAPAELRVLEPPAAEPEPRTAEPDHEARRAVLEAAVAVWRERAFAEARAREADATVAFQRQRELVTVLHRQLIANEQLHAALAWERRPWWRRVGRRGPAVVMPPLSA